MPDPRLAREAEIYDAMFGAGSYAAAWTNMPVYKKVWYTLRGWNPGGRRGAPSI